MESDRDLVASEIWHRRAKSLEHGDKAEATRLYKFHHAMTTMSDSQFKAAFMESVRMRTTKADLFGNQS